MEKPIEINARSNANERYCARSDKDSRAPKLSRLAASMATAAVLSIALGACGGSSSDPAPEPVDTGAAAPARIDNPSPRAAAGSNTYAPTPAPSSGNDDVLSHEPRARAAFAASDTIPMWSDVQGAQNPQN